MASKSMVVSSLLLVLVMLCSFCNLAAAKRKNFVYYAHAITEGPNATSVTVAGLNGSSSNLIAFGTVNILDHPLTLGPHPSSKFLGRIQGMESSSDVNQNEFRHLATSIFLAGRYNGSTIEMQGTNRFGLPKRELAVIGGTEQLKYARGHASLEIVAISGPNITFKFNATVFF